MRQSSSESSDNDDQHAISGDTHVKLGVVLSVILGCITVAVSAATAIWWAATVSSKLDSMLVLYHSLSASGLQIHQDVDAIARRVEKLELVGSPKVGECMNRLNSLENELATTRTELERNTQHGCPKAIDVDRRVTVLEGKGYGVIQNE